ncbi:hypothetical protein Tco_0168138 [Tanacetum coccineum]
MSTPPQLQQVATTTTAAAAAGFHHHRRCSSNHHRQQQQVATTTTPPVATNTAAAAAEKFDSVNANEDNADFINNEDDVVAHVLDDDDVEVSDDDEVNPSTNVEEMACVAPRSHGGDAGGSPPRRPTRPVPAQCQSSMLRLETGNRSLRKAFRENNEQPLKIGFDYEDLGLRPTTSTC